jgi:hypothetical protein
MRTGAYDEAGHWLDACEGLRPDDFPVTRARLNWGIAVKRIDIVQRAMEHLPAAEATPAQVARLRAWLAVGRGDRATERSELERLLVFDPADRGALDRLAELAERDGQLARAAELRRKKAEIDRLRDRFEKLHKRKQPIRDAAEMAHLAEQLGRQFEARAFLTLAISADPDREDLRRDLARLGEGAARVAHDARTLVDVVARQGAGERKIATTPSPDP